MDAVKSFECNGKRVEIDYDPDPESPREWDNLGTILYTSARYTLGDKRTTSEEIRDTFERKDVIAFPVYAYIHSGTALSLSPFSCPWDSGQCGIIFCTREAALKKLGRKRLTRKGLATIRKIFQGEIETYADYLDGNVYGYRIEPNGDSCWGFYGLEYCEESAREACK